MDVSVKPTEMQNYAVQSKYLFWHYTFCSSVGLNWKGSPGSGCLIYVLHRQGRLKDNVCVGGKLQQGDSEMTHTNSTNSF